MSEKHVIDARGTFCPGPLMELIAAMKLAAVGDEIEVLSTDAGSAADIPEWIQKVGHQHVSTTSDSGVWHVVVRKTEARAQPRGEKT
jgi:tRNA 2-thiouridine synthesizing protein A